MSKKIKISKDEFENINSIYSLCEILTKIRNRYFHINGAFSPQDLLKYTSENNLYYNNFKIKKRKKGYREISAPCNELKILQLCIKDFLSVLFKPSKNIFGFVKYRSIVDNAQIHKGNKYMLNIDLEDFFSSINRNKIQKVLTAPKENFGLGLSKEVSSIIASIVTTKVGQKGIVLPQGSPTSPIISNIVMASVDDQFGKIEGVKYTRYADDMTFSSNGIIKVKEKRKNKLGKIYKYENIKKIYLGKNGKLYSEIEEIIKSNQLKINDKKVHISKKGSKQTVTGLIVSNKINLPRKYIKQIRTEIHNWEMDGYSNACNKFFIHYFRKNKNRIGHNYKMENIIDGKLSYLKMVKGEHDKTYDKLKTRFNNLCSRDKEIMKNETKDAFDYLFDNIETIN